MVTRRPNHGFNGCPSRRGRPHQPLDRTFSFLRNTPDSGNWLISRKPVAISSATFASGYPARRRAYLKVSSLLFFTTASTLGLRDRCSSASFSATHAVRPPRLQRLRPMSSHRWRLCGQGLERGNLEEIRQLHVGLRWLWELMGARFSLAKESCATSDWCCSSICSGQNNLLLLSNCIMGATPPSRRLPSPRGIVGVRTGSATTA